MVRRLSAGLLITFVLPLLAPTDRASATAQPLTISAGKYGVNQDLAWDPPDQVVAEIRLMKSAGVQWLRLIAPLPPV
jgi:hypothetical protein